MAMVEGKALLQRLNPLCTRALHAAAGLCISREQYEVGVEHLLLTLVEEPQADLPIMLRNAGVDPSRLQKILHRSLESFRAGNTGKPVFAEALLDWLQDAWLMASLELRQEQIRSGALVLALLSARSRFLAGSFMDVLEPLSPSQIVKDFTQLTAGSSENEPESSEVNTSHASPSARGKDTALGRYTIDFTARARANEIDPVFGRDLEITQMIDILARRRKNNPICVGEAGVGKTAVVEGLALKVVQGDVPEALANVDILCLDLGLLQAGAGMRGEFENRLKNVIAEVNASSKPLILFIDEAHMLIGAGGAAGMGDAANLLKPALARGELRTIAATTRAEYKKHFENDAALARRFQLVGLDEPSVSATVDILRGLRHKYEESHQVQVADDAIRECARMASRYISGRQLPDKAVDVLDTAAARVKIGHTDRPRRLQDRDRQIRILEREQEALKRDATSGLGNNPERLGEIEEELSTLRAQRQPLEARWKEEKAAVARVLNLRQTKQQEGEDPDLYERISQELREAEAHLQTLQATDPLIKLDVDTEVIGQIVSDWTGIPVGKMVQDEAQSIMDLPEKIRQRIKGQDNAIQRICDQIKNTKAGIGNANAPLGVFLLVGPSGVGKTETALCLADLMFGGERFLTTLNMSEFYDEHTVSRLIGSAPGLVGYGEGGQLTEPVRQRPYSVLLLDEVEKADREVLNLFYRVFDEGKLRDSEGRIANFTNTVILLTSNLASKEIIDLMAKGKGRSLTELEKEIRPILNEFFQPALLNRMTVVPYGPLHPDTLKAIVQLKLQQIRARLFESHKMEMTYGEPVVEAIAARCQEVEAGARSIDHILRGNLLPKISSAILQKLTEGTLPNHLEISMAEDGGFQLEFQEGSPSSQLKYEVIERQPVVQGSERTEE